MPKISIPMGRIFERPSVVGSTCGVPPPVVAGFEGACHRHLDLFGLLANGRILGVLILGLSIGLMGDTVYSKVN